MRRESKTRFWVEAALAGLCALLLLLTLVWRDWIEGVFGVDPDQHSGSLEWLIVVALAAATLTLGALARREWRRGLAAPSAG
jgi:hypothetical protein